MSQVSSINAVVIAIMVMVGASAEVTAQQSGTGECAWELIDNVFEPDSCHETQQVSGLAGAVTALGIARTRSTPEVVSGSGVAFDKTVFGSMTINCATTGIRQETWQHNGQALGRASVSSAYVTIKGTAHLLDAHCAAYALGYTEYSSNITVTVRAVLAISAGQTEAEQLGNLTIPFQGLEVELPVTVSTGEGTYPDDDDESTAGDQCVNLFVFKHRSRGAIFCFANATLFTLPHAESRANLLGRVKSKFNLGCCPGGPGHKH